jgi:hypothetical protein
MEQDYERVDLRRDLLLMGHDNQGHTARGSTMNMVKMVAYWPTLNLTAQSKGSAAAHIENCAHCIAKQEGKEEHGVGVDSMRRTAVLQMDHLVLTDEEAVMAESIGALQMVDVASRFGVSAAADSQSAEETARLIFEYWVPYFGVPEDCWV